MGTIRLWKNDWSTLYDAISTFVLEKYDFTTSVIKFLQNLIENAI